MSDVCASDLDAFVYNEDVIPAERSAGLPKANGLALANVPRRVLISGKRQVSDRREARRLSARTVTAAKEKQPRQCARRQPRRRGNQPSRQWKVRSEEHTSELQSLMRISYAVSCMTKKK